MTAASTDDRRAASEASEGGWAGLAGPGPAERSASAGCVLIIEPDAAVASIVQALLARDGFDVLTAETGQGGLHLANQQNLDLVLLDRHLADVDSMDLVRRLRSSPAPCEVIVTAADATVETFVDAIDAGAFDLLVKPFGHLRLVTAKVLNAVAKVRAERQRDELAQRLQSSPSATGARADNDGGPQAPDTAEAVAETANAASAAPALPNAAAGRERFRIEAARALRYDRPLTIALLSVDRLDQIADANEAPDAATRILDQIGALVKAGVRDVDAVTRCDDAHLMLILPETVKADGVVVGDRLCRTLAAATFIGSRAPLGLTASIGLAGLPDDTMNGDRLWDAARTALARARTSGNAVTAYKAER